MTRHLTETERTGGIAYRFNPSKVMRAAGFRSEVIGYDKIEALERVNAFNEEWDEIREARELVKRGKTPEPIPPSGTWAWLVRRFKRDPAFMDLATATQKEADYALGIIGDMFSDMPVIDMDRQILRAYYTDCREKFSTHKTSRLMKWIRWVLEFGVEIGMTKYNASTGMKIKQPKARTAIWTPDQVQDFLDICPRPSVNLAVMIAYDTTLPQQDILALTWGQYDGEALSVEQKKERGGKPLYLPLNPDIQKIMDATRRATNSTHVIVSEMTGQPYRGKNDFGQIFRRWRNKAGIEGLTFHDLRSTAMTEMGESGATEAEIVSMSGHKFGSKTIAGYVQPTKETSRNAARKRQRKDKKE